MSKNLRKPDLLIISDTMIIKENNKIIAFEPVVREIENFIEIFENITWIGFEYQMKDKQYSARECLNPKVTYITIPRIGGHSIQDKIKILIKIPILSTIILKEISKHNVIHTRGPSVPALLAIIFSYFFKHKTFWHKFAGNWNQTNPPLSYALQRFLLKKLNHTFVTVNGKWENQESHILSFENPCITHEEYLYSTQYAVNKKFNEKLNFCFVGRLEDPKGVQFILKALKEHSKNNKIGTIHFIGNGKKLSTYKKFADNINLDIKFHGFLSKEEINKIYKISHFLLLPSYASEGFPKVIAEAAAFGSIPIVSDVSSIPQYINNTNGFIISNVNEQKVIDTFNIVLNTKDTELKKKSLEALKIREKFTYTYYNQRIQKEILSHE